MHIGINGNEANIKNRVGVNTYAFQILKGLYDLNNKSASPHKFTVFLADQPLSDLPKENKNWKYKILKGKGLWIITRLMPHLLLSKNRPDVLFTPSHYVAPFAGTPQVLSIMDLGYLESSEQFKKMTFWQLKYWTAISVFVSKKIIAISKATKEDLIKHYQSIKNKIDITYLSHDEDFNKRPVQKSIDKVKDKYNIKGDYVLYLGTLKPSKNVERLVQSFKEVSGDFDGSLVIAGMKGWMYKEIFATVKRLDLEKRVIFTDFFPEEDKKALMAGAKLLASPSLTEGFGIHVLESMALGVPVVISDVGSLPEVGADAAIYVDPKNVKSIARGLKKVLNLSMGEYDKLVTKCRLQSKKFSWNKTARETMKIIESAV